MKWDNFDEKQNKSMRRFMLKKKTKSELQITNLGSNESFAMGPYTKPMLKNSDLGKTARGSIALTVRVRQTDRQC